MPPFLFDLDPRSIMVTPGPSPYVPKVFNWSARFHRTRLSAIMWTWPLPASTPRSWLFPSSSRLRTLLARSSLEVPYQTFKMILGRPYPPRPSQILLRLTKPPYCISPRLRVVTKASTYPARYSLPPSTYAYIFRLY